MNNNAHRNLATRENASRIASIRYEQTGIDQAVVRTQRPEQPFVVEPFTNQRHVIDIVSSDIELIQQFLAGAA